MGSVENILTLVPLKNTLILPDTMVPILIGRTISKKAIEAAMENDKQIICISQKSGVQDKITSTKDLYRTGTLCNIIQLLPLPDGNIRILVEGISRISIGRFFKRKTHFSAKYSDFPQKTNLKKINNIALIRSFKKTFVDYAKLTNIPEEAIKSFDAIDDAVATIFNLALGNVSIPYEEKQSLYELTDSYMALLALDKKINEEIQIINLERKIDSDVKAKLSKMQRDYYLSEQLKSINKELGLSKEGKTIILDFKEKLNNTTFTPDVKKKVEEEIDKLARLNNISPEYSVVHTYLTWIFDLPWEKSEAKDFDLDGAQQILDKDHYGLKKVKELILEYLAILKLTQKVKGQILCFVGPPGVGKTSLGKSIAKAMDRKFVRLSLGGVRDEAEIRGHRRTYVGAMPGVIIQSMKKANTKNPLIMMDEIDKMSMDFRGDPASALLEVLDPEQNDTFRDHYLDFEYDLSEVVFITTANTLSSIPQPLIDRMEIIEIPGYTSIEKINIAMKHLVPRIKEDLGIEDKLVLNFKKSTIKKIIENYTREAGVRELERIIMKIHRKAAKEFIQKKTEKDITVEPKDLKNFLGIPPHLYSEVNRKNSVGIVTGLAWTQYGGETLEIEVIKMHGEGKLKLTGQLGDVMQESAQAGYSYARLHHKEYGIDKDFYKKCDLHLHIPEGAIPKDGPSAGVTMVTAMISVLSDKKVKHNIAMTGEITLTGKVLPIGGLAEKLIATKRAGIKTIIIPEKNTPNFTELPEEIKKGLNIIYAKTIDDVLDNALI